MWNGVALRVKYEIYKMMNHRYLIWVLSGILIIYFSSACAINKTEKMMSAKIDQNCDFGKLDLNVPTGKTDCSPVVTIKQIMDGLSGVFINMPKKIPLKSAKEIKVCLLNVMGSKDAAKYGGSELLVLKSDVTNKVYNGRFIDDDREAPPPTEEQSTNESNVDTIQEGYFNFNLNTYMDFDRKPGIYHLYITMGPFSSNVITFEIMPEK